MSEDRVLGIIFGRRSRKKHDWKIKNKLTLRPFSNHIAMAMKTDGRDQQAM